MTVRISAPYPGEHTTITLPSPEFGDGTAVNAGITSHRSMLGRLITYAKTSDQRVLSLSFNLTKAKALELAFFVKSFQSAEWRIRGLGVEYRAKLKANNLIETGSGRTGVLSTGSESVTVDMTLLAKVV
jgi:hypothetical protein